MNNFRIEDEKNKCYYY